MKRLFQRLAPVLAALAAGAAAGAVVSCSTLEGVAEDGADQEQAVLTAVAAVQSSATQIESDLVEIRDLVDSAIGDATERAVEYEREIARLQERIAELERRIEEGRTATAEIYTEAEVAMAAQMDALSAAWGHPAGQLALAWLLAKPNVASVVIGPGRLASLEDNAAAADLDLSDDQLAEVEAVGA